MIPAWLVDIVQRRTLTRRELKEIGPQMGIQLLVYHKPKNKKLTYTDP